MKDETITKIILRYWWLIPLLPLMLLFAFIYVLFDILYWKVRDKIGH